MSKLFIRIIFYGILVDKRIKYVDLVLIKNCVSVHILPMRSHVDITHPYNGASLPIADTITSQLTQLPYLHVYT